MPTIDYKPVGFPTKLGARLSEPNKLHCLWSDIVWSAITVGRKNWPHVVRHRKYSYLEMIYRSAMLYANLQESRRRSSQGSTYHNYLVKSPAYESLDPSEKSAISYFLGLTAAKLFAAKLLGISWLMHLDVYQDLLDPQISGNLRPDLVGIDSNSDWVVIEAKGRSNGLNKAHVRKAKKQAQAVAKIAGRRPTQYIGLASYFSSRNNTLKVFLVDPPVEEGHGIIELDITSDAYIRDYYTPARSFLESDYGHITTVRDNDRPYLTKRIMEADIHVGLDERVYKLLGRGEDTPLSEELFRILFDVPHSSEQRIMNSAEDFDRRLTVGGDGFYVELGDSWNSELMSRPPQQRIP